MTMLSACVPVWVRDEERCASSSSFTLDPPPPFFIVALCDCFPVDCLQSTSSCFLTLLVSSSHLIVFDSAIPPMFRLHELTHFIIICIIAHSSFPYSCRRSPALPRVHTTSSSSSYYSHPTSSSTPLFLFLFLLYPSYSSLRLSSL